MKLEIEVTGIEIQEALKIGAEAANLSVNEYAGVMLEYSFNSAQAMLGVQQVAGFLQTTILQKLEEIQINSYASRHQITNLHADLLGENEQRALDIATEANLLANETLYGVDTVEEV